MTDYILSFILIILGIKIIILKKFYSRGGYVDFTSYNLYILTGGSLILFGILWLYSSLKLSKNKSKSKITIEHTICPTCKQTFNYKDLKDGKCPTCKDTDTIEIEQYYKDNPFKEDDEN